MVYTNYPQVGWPIDLSTTPFHPSLYSSNIKNTVHTLFPK